MTQQPIAYFLNGPNTNLYGVSSASHAPGVSFAGLKADCEEHAKSVGIWLRFLQSNHEGQIVDWIQEAKSEAAGLAINGAGLTYTSIAVLDGLLAFEKPIIEVHMSNIWRREPFRHHSYISRAATGIIAGFGARGYKLAISTLAELIDDCK